MMSQLYLHKGACSVTYIFADQPIHHVAKCGFFTPSQIHVVHLHGREVFQHIHVHMLGAWGNGTTKFMTLCLCYLYKHPNYKIGSEGGYLQVSHTHTTHTHNTHTQHTHNTHTHNTHTQHTHTHTACLSL